MNSKIGKLLVAVVAVVIVGLLVFFISTAGRSSAFPPLPSPNGYDDLVKAGQSIKGPAGDFPTLSQTALQGLLLTNAEALRLCRLGLSRTCSVPTEATITNFAVVMPELADLKRVAQLLAAEGRLAEMEHRPGDAARTYAEAVLLGNDVSRGGLLINRLVGIAIQAIGGTRLARLIPELNPQDARPALRLLDQVDADAVTWEDVEHNEKLFCRHELRRLPNFISAIVGWWNGRATRAKARERHNAALAHVRLITLELGLRCYAAENQRAPSALQDLVPRYLSHVPPDPFTGQPFIYKPQQMNWVAYSVGPDGVDDGGSAAGRRATKGDILYSSSW